MTIRFPDPKPNWQWNRDAISFHAHVDGDTVMCIVPLERLLGVANVPQAAQEDVDKAWANQKTALEEAARTLIENGAVANGEVIIR